ncbi:hypothetical protein C4588_02085 [Candidatus Parcubacteria bacterium]|nr:MAG: hypothetical protein C4588_02085 [Candidatus Parcubacteria bacterium]
MKGKLKYSKWRVIPTGLSGNYIAERYVDEKVEYYEIRAHCLACAKTEVLMKRGGKVDTRGWYLQGMCGAFMKGTNDQLEEIVS